MRSNLQRYERIAFVYDLLDLPFEYFRYRHLRPMLFHGLEGRLLDAGVGTGRNIPYYPQGSHVFGVDFSAAMLARAQARAGANAHVELRQMDVIRLDFPDGSFDAAVATFLFCVLPEEAQVRALGELRRVVKPGGMIRLLEYTRPRGLFRRLLTFLWDPWVQWAYGASFDRRTEAHIPEADLELVESRYVFDELIKLISARRSPAP